MRTGDSDQQPVGFVCRACGCGHFEVVRTVRQQGGRVKRERRCRNCGRRMATVEMPLVPPGGEK